MLPCRGFHGMVAVKRVPRNRFSHVGRRWILSTGSFARSFRSGFADGMPRGTYVFHLQTWRFVTIVVLAWRHRALFFKKLVSWLGRNQIRFCREFAMTGGVRYWGGLPCGPDLHLVARSALQQRRIAERAAGDVLVLHADNRSHGQLPGRARERGSSLLDVWSGCWMHRFVAPDPRVFPRLLAQRCSGGGFTPWVPKCAKCTGCKVYDTHLDIHFEAALRIAECSRGGIRDAKNIMWLFIAEESLIAGSALAVRGTKTCLRAARHVSIPLRTTPPARQAGRRAKAHRRAWRAGRVVRSGMGVRLGHDVAVRQQLRTAQGRRMGRAFG